MNNLNKSPLYLLFFSFTFLVASASTCLIPLRLSTKNGTPSSSMKERQKLALKQKRQALAQRIENLRIEFNHFHPSHLRSDEEARKLAQFTKNNSYWKFSPIGGVGEFGYTSRGSIDSTRIYDFRTLTEIDQLQSRGSLLLYENEKLGDSISRHLFQQMMDPQAAGHEFDRVSRLVTALESLTPRNWKVVPHLPLPKQEPALGLRAKEYLRKSHYRYFEIARRYFHTVEKRNLLVLSERSLSWMVYLDRTRPHSNSLNKNLATLLLSEARQLKPPKTQFRRLHSPQFESLALSSRKPARSEKKERHLVSVARVR